jgi:beta-1,4-mannosyl-glycoprotein beta-1,4-N-acetylglucosaminyltransferase
VIWSLTPLFNELDVFEIRLAELDPVVDIHVVSEARLTYSGDEKPLHLAEQIDDPRWDPWRHKIRLVEARVPAGKDGGRGRLFEPHDGLRWQRENLQRDALLDGCAGLGDDDLVLLSDADEIPSSWSVEAMDDLVNAGEVWRTQLPQHVMYLDWRWTEPSTIAICRFTDGATLRRLGPQGVRLREDPESISEGWHFSYMGGAEMIRHKILSAAHSELEQPAFIDRDRIVARLESGTDMFDRDRPLRRVPIDELPRHVQDNEERFGHMLARRDP